MRIGLVGAIYLTYYLGDIDTLREIVSALLAIVLWPLLLLGVDLHVRG